MGLGSDNIFWVIQVARRMFVILFEAAALEDSTDGFFFQFFLGKWILTAFPGVFQPKVRIWHCYFVGIGIAVL